jgi:hypothetical protein
MTRRSGHQLGYAYRFLDRFADAEAAFKKYTELIPTDPNPYDSSAELLPKSTKAQPQPRHPAESSSFACLGAAAFNAAGSTLTGSGAGAWAVAGPDT